MTGSYMASGCFAHLKPLASDFPSQTLALCLSHLPSERALQSNSTPWPVCRDVLSRQLVEQKLGHNRHSHRVFHAVRLFEVVLPLKTLMIADVLQLVAGIQ